MKSSEEVIGKLKSVISDIEESKQEDSITLTYKSALEHVIEYIEHGDDFTIAMYELGKWIGRELYYKLTANDEVEVPKDFDEYDHTHLNGIYGGY